MNDKRKLAMLLSLALVFNTQGTAVFGAEILSKDGAYAEQMITEESISGEALPEEAESEETVPEEGVSGDTASEETVSGETLSEEGVSGETVSEDDPYNKNVSEEAACGEEYSIEAGDITIDIYDDHQSVTVGTNPAVNDEDPVITGTSSVNKVTIEHHSGKGKVTFMDLNIDASATDHAAVEANANVSIELDGENILKGGQDHAGLEHSGCGPGKMLTIDDSNDTPGSLNATGGKNGAGIGGKYRESGSYITINGGRVTATGGEDGAGIGGGHERDCSNITINSGTVTATGGDGAGIGGGHQGGGSEITINGGDVTASSNGHGAGIGGGYNGAGACITINGGTVTATGGNGAGIGGGGFKGEGSNITINEGTVTATGDHGAGIGGGSYGAGSKITINGGNVTARSNGDGAGIGGGEAGEGSNITINGGTVTATGNGGGAGIGGGYRGSGSVVLVSGNAILSAAGGLYSSNSGATIGNGASSVSGTEIEPDFSGLVGGAIIYYAPGTKAEDIISGNAVPTRIIANTFTIDYDSAGGTKLPSLSYNVVSLDLLPVPVYIGNIFTGWKVTTAGGNWTQGETIPAGTSLKGRWGNVTLTAQWGTEPEPPGPGPSGKGLQVKGISKDGYPYTGGSIKPKISVCFDGELLTEKTDYTLKYGKNTIPGTGTVTITGRGNFKDKKTVSFNIIKADLKDAYVQEDVVEDYKKGKKHNKVHPVLYMNGTKLKFAKKDLIYIYLDSTGSVSDCEPEGKYTISISADISCKNYTGSVDIPMQVTSIPRISGAKVRVNAASVKYTGKKVTPEFTVTFKGKTLAEGTDYTVIYDKDDEYISPGSHAVTLKGNGTDYYGQKRVGFKITGKYDLSDKDYVKITVDNDGCSYMKGGAKPKVSVTYKETVLREGKDYKVKYSGNTKAGEKATATVTGKGAYSGKTDAEFTVAKCDLKDLIIQINDRAESSKKDDYKKAVITITDENGKDQRLRKDKDYTAVFPEYDTPPVSGQSIEVTLTGTGDNYTGTAKVTYRIKDAKKDISKAKITIHAGKPYDYTGKKITPSANDISISLNKTKVPGDCYVITGCYNNVKKGTATLILKGTGSYYGEKKVTFKIGAVKLDTIWSGLLNLFSKSGGRFF